MVHTEEHIEKWRAENNYLYARELPDGRIAGVAPLITGTARIVIGEHSVEHGY